MKRFGLGVMLLAACSAESSQRKVPAPQTVPSLPQEKAPIDAATKSDAATARAVLPEASTQLILSLSEGWTGTDASLLRFEREPGGPWKPVGGPIPSTLGHAGLGWGRGLHPEPPKEEPTKREGDGRSPAGVFHIGGAYGYKDAPSDTELPFQRVTRSWRCVNDTESVHYNRIVNSKVVEEDWSEAEHMRRWDSLYELVIEVDHNRIIPEHGTPESGDGSCIFLHVWRRPGAPTIGCTAMELENMKGLLSWLRPEASPILVALPRARYQSLRASWQLPALD